MEKQDEVKFIRLMLKYNKIKTPREIINNSNIANKKCHYYLNKWIEKGYYNYGVALDKGWITKKGIEYFKNLS